MSLMPHNKRKIFVNDLKIPRVRDKSILGLRKSANYRNFIYKIFKTTIKDGKKIRSYVNFCKIIQNLKVRKVKPNKFFKFIFNKLALVLDHRVQNLGSVKYKLPYIIRGGKALSKATGWIKKSALSRKENSYIYKFYNEFLDIYSNVGLTINKKKEFYSNFFKERSFLRFLKFYKIQSRYRFNYLYKLKSKKKKHGIKGLSYYRRGAPGFKRKKKWELRIKRR